MERSTLNGSCASERMVRMHADAVQSADLDELERKTGRRHQFGLEAVARADEDGLMAVGFELSRHREQRHHVPARSSAGHHDGRHRLSMFNSPSARSRSAAFPGR